MSNETPICPYCKTALRYRDSRLRIWKKYSGETSHILIQRMFCSECLCLHNELPDCLVPYKHYGCEVIENVIDEVSTPEDETTQDYPCETTMMRWKAWFQRNTDNAEGILQAVSFYLSAEVVSLNTPFSLLSKYRMDGGGWLSSVTRIVINSAHRLCT